MPITHSAEKKLRQDKRRTMRNKVVLENMKAAVKKARAHPAANEVESAYSALDIAVKKQVIHANKAARLKSQLAKKIKSNSSQPKTEAK